MLQVVLYFDHNATTPLLAEARDAWLEASERFVGNPSSPHRLGQRAEAALQQAKEQLATMLGADAHDIVWTSGATESNNMVFHHVAGTLSPTAEVWVSAFEHPCVMAASERYCAGRVRRLPVSEEGVVDVEILEEQIRRRPPGLVAVMAANNETGVLQPWREVMELCRAQDVLYVCDAAQWLGKLPAHGLGGADFVSGCAHKFGGPKGVGFLKCPGNTGPFLVGGKQENGRRAGTENVAGVLAMMAALEARQRLLDAGEQNVRAAWREAFERQLLKEVPGSTVVGAKVARLWNTSSALMPEADCQTRWVVKLDRHGYAVSTGSACSSGKEEPSHVLAAMGYSAADAGRMLRFSSGWETTEDDWQSLLRGLQQVHGGGAG